METKKFKINKESENGGKKKITKSSTFSKAGFTFAGGIAGAAFTAAANGMSPNSEEQVATETVTEQPEVQQPEPSQPDPIQPEPTQPDPVTPDPNGPTPDPEDPDYVDPNEVAETLTQEIDTEDIDDDLVFTPDNYGEAYMPDGTRQFAVFGHLPDGSQVALLDIDGDGIFGDFFDAEGNLIGQIDEGLSVSDILDMADETGGYLAGLNEPWEDEGVSEGVSGELAMIDDVEEEVDEDDIFDQLTEEVDDDDSSEVDRFFEETEIEEETEAEIEPEYEEEFEDSEDEEEPEEILDDENE